MNGDTPKVISEKRLHKWAYAAYILWALSWVHGLGFLVSLIIAFVQQKRASGTIYHGYFIWITCTFVYVLIMSFLLFVWFMAVHGEQVLKSEDMSIELLVEDMPALLFEFLFLWNIYRLGKGFVSLYRGRPIVKPTAFV